MGFKEYVDEEITITTPKPHKSTIKINLSEYKDIVTNSVLKSDRKDLIQKIVNLKGEIPVFCEETKRFYMVSLEAKKKKAREVKSRDDKRACGVYLNGKLITEAKNGNTNVVKTLVEHKYNWEMPQVVFKLP